MEKRIYICECCQKDFFSDWSTEDARKEHDTKFPTLANAPSRTLASVCDDCYKAFEAWFASLSAEERAKMNAAAVEDLKEKQS